MECQELRGMHRKTTVIVPELIFNYILTGTSRQRRMHYTVNVRALIKLCCYSVTRFSRNHAFEDGEGLGPTVIDGIHLPRCLLWFYMLPFSRSRHNALPHFPPCRQYESSISSALRADAIFRLYSDGDGVGSRGGLGLSAQALLYTLPLRFCGKSAVVCWSVCLVVYCALCRWGINRQMSCFFNCSREV